LVRRFSTVSIILGPQRLGCQLEAEMTGGHPSLLNPYPHIFIVPVVCQDEVIIGPCGVCVRRRPTLLCRGGLESCASLP
jgi:hypothetical protein